MNRKLQLILLALSLSSLFLAYTYLAFEVFLAVDIYNHGYKVFCYLISVVAGCATAYIIWSPKKF